MTLYKLFKTVNCFKCNGKGGADKAGGFIKCNLCKGNGKIDEITLGSLNSLKNKMNRYDKIYYDIINNVSEIIEIEE